MRIQERCYVGPVMAGLWLLGLVALASGVDHQHPLGSSVGTTTMISIDNPVETLNSTSTSSTIFVPSVSDESNDVPSVVPLDQEIPKSTTEFPTSNSLKKNNVTKIDDEKYETATKNSDSKITNDGKKKFSNELKNKTDAKYHRVKDDEKSRESTIVRDSTITESSIVEKTSEVENFRDESVVPLLVRGEPVGSGLNATAVEDTEAMEESADTTSRGRALNISAAEPTNSLHANLTDLSDVSMDDEDKEVEDDEYGANRNETTTQISSTMMPEVSMKCVDGNRTFGIGEKIKRGCEEQCICSEGGKITDCEPVCHSPMMRAGKSKDPYCRETSVGNDGCCAILVCADSVPEPEETCVIGNKTLTRGQRFEDGCSKVCVCQAEGVLKCQPRCPPNETASGINQHDRCVALTDPRDSCCTITLCDVTLGDHEIKAENSGDLSVNLTNVKVLNSTAIKLKMSSALSGDVVVEISEDNHVWRQQKPDKNGILTNLEPAHTYFVRVTESGRTGPALQVFLPAEVIKTNIPEKMDKSSCSHRGKLYKIGAEWYDECISFCVCGEGPKTECVTIECPTDFGLDVLDPHCLDWETVPANFVPKAPQCCPQEVRCRNNGSCSYEGSRYDNWSELPTNVTGCEKRCYCEMGNVSCQAACPPITALPPPNLQCPSNRATLAHLPGDDCCSHWVCDHSEINPTDGTNVTRGPLTTEQKLVDNKEKMSNKTSSNVDETIESTIVDNSNPDHHDYETNQNGSNGLYHYPMDPGHPTIAYNGPYNPNYKPKQPTIEQVFHLNPSITNSEKSSIVVGSKEKTKSKSDLKKSSETVKLQKNASTTQTNNRHDNVGQWNNQQSTIQRFPGPLSPERFPTLKSPIDRTRTTSNVDTTVASINPNKLALPEKSGHNEQPQFVSLKPQPNSPDESYVFVPTNGESIPPTRFVNNYENSDAGPAYGDGSSTTTTTTTMTTIVQSRPNFNDPNYVVGIVNKKKLLTTDPNEIKTKFVNGGTGKTKIGQVQATQQDILPDELYRLINQRHPGLTHLEQTPPVGHSGLYDIHRQIVVRKNPQGFYDNVGNRPGNNNNNNDDNNYEKNPISMVPHIVSHKEENGHTTYHVHASEVPNTPQQIEELLAHITQHDSNVNPYRYRPVNRPIDHDYPDLPGPPSLRPGIDIPLPGSPISSHYNHPFVAQALPDQSVMNHHNVPSGFPIHGGIPGFHKNQGLQGSPDEVEVKALEALDESTIRIIFMVPSILVGLQAGVELRYTNDLSNPDPSTWKSQIFRPPNDLIATPQLEFELDGLEPSTDYKIKVTVNLRGLDNAPSSKIYSVRTLDRPDEVPTLPPQIPMDAELKLVETNSTWITVTWKKFTEYEMQFIDGVQLRYKENDGKVYAATSLIHRAVTNYVIENLKPSTNYEIGISIIPFPGQTTELISEKTIQVTTAVEPDPYSFDVKVEIKTIKSTAVEVSWSGVPYPEDKYVNIYRAIYQSDSGKEDTSTFKIAKRDSPAKTLISDLKPGTRYRLWIEVYLTNGRIKKSNVQDFVTKPGIVVPAGISQQGKLASIPLHEGDYYGPLVIVAIVASLAILSTLILLMMLMKRRSSSKADISPRKTTAAYDNPSYKTCEDAAPVVNGRSKTTDHEMATINLNADAKENV